MIEKQQPPTLIKLWDESDGDARIKFLCYLKERYGENFYRLHEILNAVTKKEVKENE